MEFVAFERGLQGTGASRRLRHAGKVPGIVYGAGTPQMIELDHNALYHALKKESFHSSILDMKLSGQTQKVLLRDVQMHAWKQLVMHVDFQRVDATTRVSKKVPLHFVNEENSQAVKFDNCLISHVVTELEIACLASQLPEHLTVDLGHLAKGQSMHVRDLKLEPGIKVVLHGRKDLVLAAVTVQKVEEEAPAEATAQVVAPAPAPTKAKKDEKQNKK